jgi:hypothetical protein
MIPPRPAIRRLSLLPLVPVMLLSRLLLRSTSAPLPADDAGPAYQRTWVWGMPVTSALDVESVESPGESHYVWYFDKIRLELTRANSDSSSIWYIPNALLAVEAMSGQPQK